MTPLTLPISSPALAAIIAEEWPGERGVARLAGVAPRDIWAGIDDRLPPHTLSWSCDPGCYSQRVPRALLSLVDALEARGLVVNMEGGVRVKGWAATRCRKGEAVCYWHGPVARWVCRIIDLPPSDPRRSAYDSEVLRARLALAEAARGPVGAAGSMGKGEMKMRGWR